MRWKCCRFISILIKSRVTSSSSLTGYTIATSAGMLTSPFSFRAEKELSRSYQMGVQHLAHIVTIFRDVCWSPMEFQEIAPSNFGHPSHCHLQICTGRWCSLIFNTNESCSIKHVGKSELLEAQRQSISLSVGRSRAEQRAIGVIIFWAPRVIFIEPCRMFHRPVTGGHLFHLGRNKRPRKTNKQTNKRLGWNYQQRNDRGVLLDSFQTFTSYPGLGLIKSATMRPEPDRTASYMLEKETCKLDLTNTEYPFEKTHSIKDGLDTLQIKHKSLS